MTEISNKQKKKEIMKDIIRKLHEGLTIEEAKERFEKEIGTVSSTEIAEIEQSLIDEGLSPEKIKNSVMSMPCFSNQPWKNPLSKKHLHLILFISLS